MQPRAEVAPSPVEEAVATPSRIASIDIFRGLTILVMIFVNDVGEVRGLPWWTHHAPPGANYMTYVDMVFPAFLFIIGMSIPLALGRRKASESTGKVLSHILLRSIGLVVMGIFLANLQRMDPHLSGIDRTVWALLGFAGIFLLWNVYPRNEERKTFHRVLKISGAVILAVMLAMFRRKTEIGQVAWLDFSYWEILGLIGCAYLAVSILYLLLERKTWTLVVALIALNTINAFSAAGKLGWMEPVLRYWPFEAGLCAITMAGVVATKIFFDRNISRSFRDKAVRASGYGALLFATGLALWPLGIAKLGDTPTWGLFSASACTFLFLALYWIADVKHQTGWAAFVKPAGSNTLLTYLLPDVWYVIPALVALGDHWEAGAPGVFRAFVFTAIMLAASAILTRWKVRLQL
jgi:heparan-alpha-glucosaminide N-acetyltransferase